MYVHVHLHKFHLKRVTSDRCSVMSQYSFVSSFPNKSEKCLYSVCINLDKCFRMTLEV